LLKVGIIIFTVGINDDSMLASKLFLQLPMNLVGKIG